MPSVTLTKIVKEPGGRILLRFGKREYEFSSIEHFRQSVRGMLDREDLEVLAMALILARQPNLGNPAALEGRTITIDFNAASWGTVS